MNYNTANQSFDMAESYAVEPLNRYVAKTFGWMFAGLLTTFLIAVIGYRTGAILPIVYNRTAFFAVGIAELVVVIFLSARIHKMSVAGARALFFTYAVLNGIVFTVYFYAYDAMSLVMVFGATSLFFGIMALLGYFTNADFSRVRPFLMGGLVFLLVFWVLSMFFNLTALETTVCYIGIFIFLAFTAYDTQKIKAYHQYYSQNPAMAAKASIFSALQLYLDFVNLFLYLIRLMGRRK